MRPRKRGLTYIASHAGLGVGDDDDTLVDDEGGRGHHLLVVHHLLGLLLEHIELPSGNDKQSTTDQRPLNRVDHGKEEGDQWRGWLTLLQVGNSRAS